MDMVKLASPDEISSLPKTSWNIHQPAEDDVREEALSTGKCFRVRIDVRGCCQIVLCFLDLWPPCFGVSGRICVLLVFQDTA